MILIVKKERNRDNIDDKISKEGNFCNSFQKIISKIVIKSKKENNGLWYVQCIFDNKNTYICRIILTR